MPLIVHISDLHISELGFEEDVFIKAVAEINAAVLQTYPVEMLAGHSIFGWNIN